MKRRQLMLVGLGGLTVLGGSRGWAAPAKSPPARQLTVQWLGHTCFLFSSPEGRILVNPFRPAGCTLGYRRPKVEADLILLSSRLLDEGALDVVEGNPRVLYQPGVFTVDNFDRLQGISTLHDRKDGRQFGINVAWRWQQAGMDILHLGSIASPLAPEEKILLGRPDILFVPVGGGPKSFDAELAQAATREIEPRLVIPTQYRTEAADGTCELQGVDSFLKYFDSNLVKAYKTNTISIAAGSLPREPAASGPQVRTFAYNFADKTTASQTKPASKSAFPAPGSPQ